VTLRAPCRSKLRTKEEKRREEKRKRRRLL